VDRTTHDEERSQQRVPLVAQEPLADLAAAPVADDDRDDHGDGQAKAEDRVPG